MHTLPHKRRVIVPVIILCVAALIFMGARFAVYPAFMSAPDHVHLVVTRVQYLPGSHTTNDTIIFNRQFGGVASAIYGQLVSEERIPQGGVGVSECPSVSSVTPYYHYELTFTRVGIQTSVATSDAHGCAFIFLNYLGGQDEFSGYDSIGVSFWTQLHQLVGAPEPI